VHLRLDDHGAPELLGRLASLLRREGEAALGDGDPETAEELLPLVLVEVHAGRSLVVAIGRRSLTAGVGGRDRRARTILPGTQPKKEALMAVAKVIELTATSESSFEDAIREAIAKANESIHGIEGAWVKEQKVIIEDGEIKGFRVDLKVTFIVD
jgi:hypothetical protein